MEELEPQIEYIKDRVNNASSILELLGLYNQYSQFNDLLLPYYEKRKQELRSGKISSPTTQLTQTHHD
jgi:hypothetical protein